MIAFLSLYHQLPGLYGTNGILPVDKILNYDPKNLLQSLYRQPNLVVILKEFGFSTFEGFELVCLFGIMLSFVHVIYGVGRTLIDVVVYILLYILYLSCVDMGQTFLHFQVSNPDCITTHPVSSGISCFWSLVYC